jgi:hypothetical protein
MNEQWTEMQEQLAREQELSTRLNKRLSLAQRESDLLRDQLVIPAFSTPSIMSREVMMWKKRI